MNRSALFTHPPTGVEDVHGVKELLDAPHERVRLAPPLHLYERRHVPPRAVLALQAARVLGGHDVAHLLHHVGEALDLGFVAETLVCMCVEGGGAKRCV